ncbi:hypothetical protein RJT34_17148 [Clitoria ternatea]|uniref:Uncharacterized protein n=1 Tax=Clitoria ternatea TaxID=43366 RepID=A0AAN9PDH9_CLITE
MSCEEEENDGVDLLRLHSDLSSLLCQIDELVVQAIKLDSVTNDGKTQIHSFSRVLSDMLSSLKPWIPKFQTALNPETHHEHCHPLKTKLVSHDKSEVCEGDSPQERTLDSLVSPSPLVSWRANCTIERGRQMFMLTPLPLSSKQPLPKSHFNEILPSTSSSSFLALSRDMTSLMDTVAVKPTPIKPPSEVPNNQISSPNFPKRDGSMFVMMTPCLKMSPPRSCVLLEPISEICHVGEKKVHKATPFPLGIHYSDSEASESPGSCDDDASQGLALKYAELLGIHQVSKSGIGKQMVEESVDWFTSPLKTCVLLEPPDEKSLELETNRLTETILKEQVSKFKDDHVSEDHNQAKKSCKKESTPMWQEPESSFRTGKHAGENTLKKELWTKFEAASTWGCQPKLATAPVQKSTHKGFLDLLEEASCD